MTAPPDSRVWSGRRAIVPFLRWASAAAVVLAVHVGGAWVLVHRITALTEPPGIPAAILIDLAPLPVSSEAPAPDVAPGPPLEEAAPKADADTPEDLPQEPVENTAAASPDTPLDEPIVPEAEAVLPPSRPPDAPRQPERKPATRKPPVERKRPEVSNRLEQTRNSAPPAAQARPVEAAASPSLGNASSSGSVQSWRGALVAHLNRHKRFPSGAAAEGTATVFFTISRAGQVQSVRLVRSSGDRLLDQESVALLNRASPVPTPPPDFARGDGAISLTVPIRFNR